MTVLGLGTSGGADRVNDRQIARHGGASGIGDPALLEMGCALAMNLAVYGEPDAFEIAAAYVFGIRKAHAFVDGNKRTAFVAAFTFFRLNGCNLRPNPRERVRMMESLASSQVTGVNFALWLRAMV